MTAIASAHPLMTVDEAALFLRILDPEGKPDRRKFYAWKERTRPHCFKLGRLLRFRREDLEAALVEEDPPAILPPSLRVTR